MRGYLILVIIALTVGTAIATSVVPASRQSASGQQQKIDKAEFESQFPLTDADKAAPADPNKHAKWLVKGKKHKGIGLRITENSELISLNTEWDIGLPALPVTKSDVIVIGEVTDAQAFLTESKDWVYSEFTIRLDEVLKNTGSLPLSQGSSLIADREGGRVRFPSGRIILQHVFGQGMPRVGRRYALFLTLDDQKQSTHILTGYELRGGRVFPIDNPAGGQHPIATVYREADDSSFLNDLRAAVAKPQ